MGAWRASFCLICYDVVLQDALFRVQDCKEQYRPKAEGGDR